MLRRKKFGKCNKFDNRKRDSEAYQSFVQVRLLFPFMKKIIAVLPL